MPRNYQILSLRVIIYESWLFAKSIVITSHFRKHILKFREFFIFGETFSPRQFLLLKKYCTLRETIKLMRMSDKILYMRTAIN